MDSDPSEIRPGGLRRQEIHDLIDAVGEAHIQEVEQLAAIPAPSFAEHDRAAHVAARFRAAGLSGVVIDEAQNVRGYSGTGQGPRVTLAAHIDTVYPRDAHRPPERTGSRLHGSSVRDNSAGVAALITLAGAIRDTGPPAGTLEFLATTGEEGLGDLRGIRYRLRPEESRPDTMLVVDGRLGQIVHQGIAVRRFRVRYETAGGHSWGDFGAPNAVHILAALVHGLTRIPLPADPKTTMNVGVIAGGTSVNAIAARAEALVDVRSIDAAEVQDVSAQLRRLAEAGAGPGVRVGIDLIGDRPGGRISPMHPLVALVRGAHEARGIETRLAAASTDANVPLALGIPAVSIGVSSGGQVHSPEEWLDITSLGPGLHVLADAVAGVIDAAARQRSAAPGSSAAGERA